MKRMALILLLCLLLLWCRSGKRRSSMPSMVMPQRRILRCWNPLRQASITLRVFLACIRQNRTSLLTCAFTLPLDIIGQDYSGLDGAVTFWYDGDNRIYDEVICVRKDIDQQLRNSVLLEEIYNGLGPAQDTVLRPDSIIYQEYAEVQDLTLVDWLILRLLYHPDMRCGMDAAECESVIRALYY